MLIVFDKDGTLMQLGSVFVKLADDLINEFSVRTDIHVPKSEIKDAFGIMDDKLDMMLQTNNTKSIVNKLSLLPSGDKLSQWMNETIQHLTSDNEYDDIEIIPGVESTLKTLKSQGHQLTIVSADDDASMDLFVDKYDIRQYFDLIVTSDTCQFQKPQAGLMAHIIETLNATQESTIMVGDTEMDVMLGKNGGVSKVIGVLSGSGDAQDLRNADIVLNDVNEIVSKQVL